MADRYWVGGTGNWSDAANHWSDSTGGAAGAVKPTTGDVVYFDGSSGTGTVTLDEDTAVLGDVITTSGSGITLAGSGTFELKSSGDVNFTGLAALTAGTVIIRLSGTSKTLTNIDDYGDRYKNIYIDTGATITTSGQGWVGTANGQTITVNGTLTLGGNLRVYNANNSTSVLGSGTITAGSAKTLYLTCAAGGTVSGNLSIVPTIGDNVSITLNDASGSAGTKTSTLTANATVKNLNIQGSSASSAYVLLATSTYTLSLSGKVLNLVAGKLTLGANVTCGKLAEDSDSTITGGGYKITCDGISGGYTADIDGVIDGNLDLDVTYTDDTIIDILPSSGSIRNLTVSPASTKTTTLEGNTTLSGNLTNSGAGTVKMNADASTLTVGGYVLNDGTLGHTTWTGDFKVTGYIENNGTILGDSSQTVIGASGKYLGDGSILGGGSHLTLNAINSWRTINSLDYINDDENTIN